MAPKMAPILQSRLLNQRQFTTSRVTMHIAADESTNQRIDRTVLVRRTSLPVSPVLRTNYYCTRPAATCDLQRLCRVYLIHMNQGLAVKSQK